MFWEKFIALHAYIKKKKVLNQWLSFHFMNLKNKNKPSVNRKKEINEQKSINFFKERKLAKLKDGSLERPAKLIH